MYASIIIDLRDDKHLESFFLYTIGCKSNHCLPYDHLMNDSVFCTHDPMDSMLMMRSVNIFVFVIVKNNCFCVCVKHIDVCVDVNVVFCEIVNVFFCIRVASVCVRVEFQFKSNSIKT